MKIRLFCLLMILSIIQISCSKESNDECEIPENCLPAMTERGANTAGCLVDGKVLVPDGNKFGSGSILKAQHVNSNEENLFGIVILDLETDRSISLEIRNEIIEEGKTYKFGSVSDSTSYASYSEGNKGFFLTNIESTGEIYFSKFDISQRIAAGTFWFNAKNGNEQIVKITNGRFDVLVY